MELDALKEKLDEKELGDPAAVDRLAAIIPDFEERLADLDDDTVLHLVAAASLFHDEVDAFELLRGCRWLAEARGGWAGFYQEQLRVWRSRKDKSQHDSEYLRIRLGIKGRVPPDRSPPRGGGGGSPEDQERRTSPGA